MKKEPDGRFIDFFLKKGSDVMGIDLSPMVSTISKIKRDAEKAERAKVFKEFYEEYESYNSLSMEDCFDIVKKITS